MDPALIKDGLLPLPEKLGGETPDFSRTAVFGTMKAEEIPDHDFMVAPPFAIKDQGEDDTCSSRATNAASEDQEGVQLEDFFTFYATKVLIMQSPETWGADLRSACLAHVKHGALDLEYSPFKHYKRKPTREEMLSPEIWTEDHMALAYEHRKNSFFAVDGPHDLFDNVRAALWIHRANMRSVVTGARWGASWTAAPGGVIPKDAEKGRSGHAFIFKGQKNIDGVLHLVAQLSNGEEIGDGGMFYFPRGIVNRDFTFGMYMFEDIPKEEAKDHLYYGTTVNSGLFERLWKILWRALLDIFKKP
jgi:hypothetical protein